MYRDCAGAGVAHFRGRCGNGGGNFEETAIKNNSKKEFKIEQGDRIAQGVFQRYYTCGDKPISIRMGGFGSSGK